MDPASRPSEPVRMAAVLALFLVPGAAGAVYLWHGVVNPVLAGRPPEASWITIAASLVAIGGVLWALVLYLRRVTKEGDG